MDTLNCCFYGNWVNSEPSEASWAAQMALKTKCSHLNTEKSLQSLRRESNCLHFCISVFFFFFSLGSCVTLPASSVAAVEGGSHGLFNLPNTQLSTRPFKLVFSSLGPSREHCPWAANLLRVGALCRWPAAAFAGDPPRSWSQKRAGRGAPHPEVTLVLLFS